MTYEGQWVSRQVCRHGIPFKDGCSDCTHPDDYHYKHTNKSSCVHGVLATVNCWECARELIKKVRVETGTSLLPDPEEHTNKTSGVECEHGVHFQTRCMECYPRPETRCPDCYPSADTSDGTGGADGRSERLVTLDL
jgi:hypothetical protein